MAEVNAFLLGIRYFIKGMKTLFRPGLRIFVLVPFLLNLIIFSGLFVLLFMQFDPLQQWFVGSMPGWLSFEWLFAFLFGIIFLVTAFISIQSFTLFGNLLIAPFNGILSEKTEILLTGEVMDSNWHWKALIKQIPQSLYREIRKILYFLPRALFLLILFIIPVVNVVAGFLWFIFGAWMMAIQYADYPMDNNRKSFAELHTWLKSSRLTALGFGTAVVVCAMIPLVNFIVMPAAVVGATIFWIENYRGKNTGEGTRKKIESQEYPVSSVEEVRR